MSNTTEEEAKTAKFKPPFVAFADIEIGDNISDQKRTRMHLDLANPVDLEFALSIDREGLISPLAVREGGPARTTGKRKVVLDCGYRRYGAIGLLRGNKVPGQKTKASSWNQIPVRYVKGDEEDQDVRNLVENLQRLNLDPYQEGAAIKAYIEKHKSTQAEVAHRLGKSEPWVSQRLSMVRNSSEEVKKAYDDGIISATMVREITDLPKDKQTGLVESLRKQAASGKYPTVEDVKEDIAKIPTTKKKTGRKATSFDQEKISVAKDAYKDKKFAPRPRPAVVEVLGTLVAREQRNSTDKTKHQIQAIEYVLGLRDTL